MRLDLDTVGSNVLRHLLFTPALLALTSAVLWPSFDGLADVFSYMVYPGSIYTVILAPAAGALALTIHLVPGHWPPLNRRLASGVGGALLFPLGILGFQALGVSVPMAITGFLWMAVAGGLFGLVLQLPRVAAV